MTSIPTRLWTYVRPYRLLLAASLCLVAVVGLLEAVTPFLIGLIFDTVLRASATPTLVIPWINIQFNVSTFDGRIFLLVLIAVTAVKAMAEYGAVTASAYLGQSVVRDLRNDVFDKILFQPLRFFHFNPTGELISRVSADVERIQTAASEIFAEFLKQTAILIFLVVAIFAIDWKLAVMSLVLVPLVFYPTVRFGRRLRLLSRSNQQEMAEMANILYEGVTGNRIVKAFGMEKAEAGRFRKVTQRVFHLNLRMKMTHALASPLMEVFGIVVVAAFLLYARSEGMSAGLFIAFIVTLIKLYDPVRRMSGINNSFQSAFGASGRIFEILSLETEKDTGLKAISALSDRIEFQDVHFGYDPGAAVLDGISFTVGCGEVVAIVGSSGAGKTTLANLLPRFYDVTAGRVLIDGHDVRDLSLESLRKQIAMVTQDVILFNDTIRANIAYGDPTADEEAIKRAAKAALVDDFVTDYGARIGERGLRLSGGERQRISIARALLKNAPILILDEATSSLDAESEALVQCALQNLMEGRTTIVIAHRLSTVRRADRIIVLADGRIKESGTHEDLVVRLGPILEALQFAVSGCQLMIYSMTGFGSSRAEAPNLSVLVEIKSVNHRYLDVHIKIPGEYQNFENVIRQRISGAFKRGRLDAFVRIDYKRENIKLDVNHSMVRAYVEMMTELKNMHEIHGDVTLEMITRLPGLVTISSNDLSTDELELIGKKVGEATDAALIQLRQMRITEGQSLMADIDGRIANIDRHLQTILAHAKDFVEHYRQQLIARVTELAPQLVAESGHRLETEALLYAERSDIAEETTRLRSHLDQFAGLKKLQDEAGKRMDFILQEMNREVTTVLSKTSGLNELGAGIGQAAIDIKVEIEKLREQVQNIE